jgi:hypothetical protein
MLADRTDRTDGAVRRGPRDVLEQMADGEQPAWVKGRVRLGRAASGGLLGKVISLSFCRSGVQRV